MSKRSHMCTKMAERSHYDLIVVGGGITGCGVAYEAATRGASVLLLEQGDVAQGTSSRSTKLIHGGIRYLRQADFRLVREGVHERQSLMEAIPYLVHPVQFLFPVHRGDPDPLWALRIGLVLYDWFAGWRNQPHKVLTRQSVRGVEPLLREEGLKGGALYTDCLTDDARLTVEVAKAAARAGAVVVTYMSVHRFLYNPHGQITGVEVADRMAGGRIHRITGDKLLNATGPWVDLVRQLDDPHAPPILRPTKGSHIAVEYGRLPVVHPVVMHGVDRRLMFAIGRDGFTYLGTTDTDFTGDPGSVHVDRADISYILAAANRMFPAAHLREQDVISAWAGIRTLAASSPTAGPSQVSRDYKLQTSASGLVSVAGGKLTAFGAMSRAITQYMLPGLSRTKVPLSIEGAHAIPTPGESAELGRLAGLGASEMGELISRHGGECRNVLPYVDGEVTPGRLRMLAAEAAYAGEHEFAVTLSDVLSRRTSQLLFSRDNGTEGILTVAAALGRVLGWDSAEQGEQAAAYQREVAAMMAWRSQGQLPVDAAPVGGNHTPQRK